VIELDAVEEQTWRSLAQQLRGVFTDVDDTLTAHGKIVPEAYAALARARDCGLRVVLVTGRPAGWAEVMASLFPVDAAIAENGAIAALPRGDRIYFDDAQTRKDGQLRRERALVRMRAELPSIELARDARLREIDLAFDIAEHETVPEPMIARATEVLRASDLRTTRSSIHLHGTYSTADKAQMCARVAQSLWGEPEDELRERYLFVGDSPNDAPAFAFFRHTIGVANVRAHEAVLANVSALPWAVTKEAAGLGFAQLIARLLNARA
jgi:HAD superfamily hydrolase (TIGR01484 family)